MDNTRYILVLNSGSSTVKFQLIVFPEEIKILHGVVDKIGSGESNILISLAGKEPQKIYKEIKDHREGLDMLFSLLSRKETGFHFDLQKLHAVGHRVVHGGEDFSGSVLINQEVIDVLIKNSKLAPLHNPPNLAGIKAINAIMPELPQAGVFDTAFHQSMIPEAYLYALPYHYYQQHQIRKYGFHGTSHHYVFKQASQFLGIPENKLKAISCHLGNGASIAAIDKGKSIDTSMGLTPNEGLIMGTRTGNLDNGALLYIADLDNKNPKQLNQLINKESGLLGISGLSNDMRVLEEAAAHGNQQASLAIRMFNYRIKQYIGMYLATLNGADVIIFTGGIGENSPTCRKQSCENLQQLGIQLDDKKNNIKQSGIRPLHQEGADIKILVIPTNEEIMIARETLKLIS